MKQRFGRELEQRGGPPCGIPSQATMDHYLARGRKLHGRAVRQAFRAAGRILSAGLRQLLPRRSADGPAHARRKHQFR